jgi:lipopolysaccharide exporter
MRPLIHGALWSGLNTAILRLGQFVVSIIAARLISPHEFGVFVVGLTIYLVIINISEIGVSSALVREIDNVDQIAPTVSTIAIASSFALAVFMYSTAPFLAQTLGAPGATDAVRVLAIPLLFAGPSAVPAALLTRDFLQGRKFAADLANFLIATITLVVLALDGQGVMALAWSRVAGQIASTILIYVLVPHRYAPGLDTGQARRLLRFGGPLAGANLVGFSLANIDFIAVGRLAGPLQLGYYNLAFTVTSWPTSILTTVLNSVIMPALARVRGGVSELARHINAAVATVCAVSFPITAACVALAHPLVTVLYGATWAPAAPILMVLATYGSVRILLSLFSDIMVVGGRTVKLLHLQLLWLAALAPAMFAAVYYGNAMGAAIAHVVVVIVIVVPAYLIVLVRSVGLPLRVLIAPAVRPLATAAMAGGAAYLVAVGMHSPWMKLLVGGGCFALIYVLALATWLLNLKRELVRLYGQHNRASQNIGSTGLSADEPNLDLTDSDNVYSVALRKEP